jgi:hypothetical protein
MPRPAFIHPSTPSCPYHTRNGTSLLPVRLHDLDNLVHHRGIAQCTCITQGVLLATQDLAQDSSHDLAGSRLWEIIDNEDSLRRSEGADRFSYLEDQVLSRILA